MSFKRKLAASAPEKPTGRWSRPRVVTAATAAVVGIFLTFGVLGQFNLLPTGMPTWAAPVQNVRVVLPSGKGESSSISYEQRVGTTGHELYVHPLRFQQGRPEGHGDVGGPTPADFDAAERRSINNYKKGLKTQTPATVKPKR